MKDMFSALIAFTGMFSNTVCFAPVFTFRQIKKQQQSISNIYINGLNPSFFTRVQPFYSASDFTLGYLLFCL